MNKKILLFSLFCTPAMITQSFPGMSSPQQKMPSPNILWITIEDTSPQFIGCYGNEHARTPVIDRLASEGIRFTNAFSTGTVCSPSRTALITGVKTYKAGTGNHRSKYRIPDYIQGFPYYLRHQGYYTTNNAKTDYNVEEEAAFIHRAWNESSGSAGWWNRKAGQPFFAVFNFMESHQSRTMTETYDWYQTNVLEHLSPEERIGENEFDMPPFYFDSREMRRQFARVYNSIKLTDNRIGELLMRLERDQLTDSTIIFFFADHGEGMPRGKTNGINYGYRVPFIVWFPEMYKHLSPWGTAGVVTDELVDFTDFAPAVLRLAGVDIPEHMEGRSFIGNNRTQPVEYLVLSSDRSDNGIDMVRSVTDGRYVYSRNFMPYMYEARYIRYMEISDIKQLMRNDLANNNLNELQKSLFQERPAEFLFDIDIDPWETRNLAEDLEYKPLIDKMRKLLEQEILNSRDVMFLPENEIELLSGTLPAYEFRNDPDRYPLDQIYQAASLAGFRGKDIAGKQAELLSDNNSVIRYWAIVGLRSQHRRELQMHSEAVLKAMNDTYPPVAVYASAIAYEFFNDVTAGAHLKQYCLHDNNLVSLMAINSLLYLTNKEPFIDTIRAVQQRTDREYYVRAACMDFLGSLHLVPNNPDYRQ